MTDLDSTLEALIAKARSDGSALGQLLSRYRPFLVAIARRQIGMRLSVRADASDVVQQTLVEAHRAFPAFEGAGEPAFSVWINRILERNVQDAIRKHVGAAKQSIDREQRADALADSASFCWWEPAGDLSSPSQHLIKGERALRLAAILESLPELQREAVRLRHLEGWHVEQIARQLDRSLTATAGLIKRGLRTLRAKMAEDSWDSV